MSCKKTISSAEATGRSTGDGAWPVKPYEIYRKFTIMAVLRLPVEIASRIQLTTNSDVVRKHIHGALDLLVRTPGGDIRVEVKGRRRPSADKVEVTWREVERSQRDVCVLFVVDAIDVDAVYNCKGGYWREFSSWRVQDGDDDLKPIRSLYTLGKSAASGRVEVPASALAPDLRSRS